MTKRKFENEFKENRPKKVKFEEKEIEKTSNSLVRGEVNALPAVPGLCISNFGEIPMPISEMQAEKLVKFLSESKSAHKPAEHVYELQPSEIQIKNKIWMCNLNKLANKLAPELGQKDKVEAKFNKLLFFTKGACLKRAKDEIKVNQFATLIIQLPSCFTGGDLVVYGKNSHKRCDFGLTSKKAPFLVHYAVYNSDNEHEIMEVKSGSRFFLVYDLCLVVKKAEIAQNKAINVNDFFIGFLPWIEMKLMVKLERASDAYHDEHALRTLESLIRNRNLRLSQDFIGNTLRRFSKNMCPCIAGLIKLFGWHPLQTCLSRFLIPITFEIFSINCHLVQCLLMINEENSAFLCFDRCVKPVLANKEDFKAVIQDRYGFVQDTKNYIDLAKTILSFKDPERESFMILFNASIIDTLGSDLYPNLFLNMVKHLSEYKSNKFLLDLFKYRIEWLEIEIKKIDDKFSWCMPEATMPKHKKVQEFLRSDKDKMFYTSIFKTSHDANEFIKLYGDLESQLKNGYSANMCIDKDMSTVVVIHKTRKYYESRLNLTVKFKQELINTINLYTNFKKVV